jgi:predicted Zn-dependent protease
MKRSILLPGFLVLAVGAGSATPAVAQLGRIMRGVEKAQKVYDIKITDQEEQELGAAVSERIRARYGVVQDPAVHRYVSLVGTVLAQAGTRPGLAYKFIVLDTDAVNAFAAPGGYIHVTRGTLALLKNEAELAGVLGHELVHVTERHTIEAIQKGKMVEFGVDEKLAGNGLLLDKLADKSFEVLQAGFGRGEELEADRHGVALANKLGYAPGGLTAFLTRLTERNAGAAARRGLFASHPEMKERLTSIEKQVAADKLAGAATVEARYTAAITFKAKPQADIAVVEAGAAGLAGGTAGKDAAKEGDKKAEEEPKKRRGFGLGNLVRPGGDEKKSAQVTGSAGARGVDPEVDAKGGPVATLVAVTLTPADIEAFKQGIK